MFLSQLFVLLILCATALADVSEIAGAADPAKQQENPVTDICLGCICEAISECNVSLRCAGDVCGLFRITWAYWSDSGKPSQSYDSVESQTAYSNCVNEPLCAARAVQGYMRRFAQDCNGDGVVNCYDFAAIHKFGGYGCSAPLPDWYKSRFDQCLSLANQYQG